MYQDHSRFVYSVKAAFFQKHVYCIIAVREWYNLGQFLICFWYQQPAISANHQTEKSSIILTCVCVCRSFILLFQINPIFAWLMILQSLCANPLHFPSSIADLKSSSEKLQVSLDQMCIKGTTNSVSFSSELSSTETPSRVGENGMSGGWICGYDEMNLSSFCRRLP